MDEPNITIKVGVSSSMFTSGKPTRSETLPDGRARHHMPDGKIRTVPATAGYLIHYLSSRFGAPEGETYEIPVCLFGLSDVPGFLETWNFEIGEVRAYAFDKIVRMTEVDGTNPSTGEEIRVKLGGSARERRS